MDYVGNYKIIEEIYETLQTVVYRGVQENKGIPVIIKVLKRAYTNFYNIAQWKHDYEISNELHLSVIMRSLELIQLDFGLALVLEDFGGKLLADHILYFQKDIETFLQASIKLSYILETIHRYFIHKDINPKNFFIHSSTGKIKVTGFGICSLISEPVHPSGGFDLPLENLAYISPEQTGKLNRSIDYRTDFYSLGITFYEMLTGKLPLNSDDPTELAHLHITQMPIPPHDLNPLIPWELSQIVMKLLEKSPEKRYQSAIGLKTDLEICLHRWLNGQQGSHFILGEHDILNKETSMREKVNNLTCERKINIFATLSELCLLDWMALIKASQIFSQKQADNHAIHKWLHAVIELAGAQRGVFLTEKEGKLIIKAEVSNNGEKLTPFLPLELTHNLPQGLLQYVKRTGKYVILSNGSREGLFTQDPYILKKKPKSILSLPLFKDSTFLGVLYLENNLISDVFSPKRLEVLKILSLQMYIFLENSRLEQELKNIKQNIENQGQLWKKILDSLTYGVIFLDKSYIVIWVNAKAKEYLSPILKVDIGSPLKKIGGQFIGELPFFPDKKKWHKIQLDSEISQGIELALWKLENEWEFEYVLLLNKTEK